MFARQFAAAILAVLLGSHLGSIASAQPGPASPAAGAGPTVRATLDAGRAELEQTEAALTRPSLSSGTLQELRGRIEPVAERFRDVIAALAPQLDAAKARLDQLGPKPKEGAAAEGGDVARDRGEREAAVVGLDDTSRLARALLLQAEQLTAQVSDRRRAAFANALLERSYSLASPDLWISSLGSLPRDLRALRIMLEDAAGRFAGRASPTVLTLLALALGAAIALHIARRQIAPRLVHRAQDAVDVEGRRRLLSALGILVFDALPAGVGGFVVYQLVAAADVLPPRLDAVMAAILAGIAFVAFASAAFDAIFAPGRPAWRIVKVSDLSASRLATFGVGFAAVVVTGRVLEAANQAIAATLPLSVATRGFVALVAALTLAELLRRFAAVETQEENCLGPYIPAEAAIGGPARLVGWAITAVIIVSVFGGYVALASFLVEQIAWIGSITAVLFFATRLTDEFLGRSTRANGRLSTTLQANLGLRRRALEQFGILGAGLARVVLVIAAAMLALAPWGVESSDIASNFRAAFFGFRVGEVTISLSTTAFALLLFGAGVGATRIVQSWLTKTFLPTTELDSGLRNSIETAVGYLGFFAAAAVALSYLGLGLEKIAIVAGALSVGIGFGLQSVVNNFVSGLILLWERPIRVGDLVVIGDGEGYVRRISVRATEIETFDRSSVIIPNSNIISGVVKNRVRGDRTGRIVLPLRIGRDKDPVIVAQALTHHASRHPDVLKEPPPRVLFKAIGEGALDLDLVCFVGDVAKLIGVTSDLNFSIFADLVEKGVIPRPGPAVTALAGLEPVQSALQHIAEAIAANSERREGSARDTRRPRGTAVAS